MKRKGFNADDIHGKLMNLQEENQKLKKNAVSINDMERLIQQNRQMKMEIHKLQMAQYAQSNFDTKSQVSLQSQNKRNIQSENLNKFQSKNTSDFDFSSNSEFNSPRNHSSGNIHANNSQYSSNQTNSSLARIGKGILENEPSRVSDYHSVNKAQRKKQKQKILDKLEELQKIQKFNEQKLMKDLEQLEKKNHQSKASSAIISPMKKKVFAPPLSSVQKRQTVNYEDKIKELEARLFGK